MKPAFSYYGGKQNMVRHILLLIPLTQKISQPDYPQCRMRQFGPSLQQFSFFGIIMRKLI